MTGRARHHRLRFVAAAGGAGVTLLGLLAAATARSPAPDLGRGAAQLPVAPLVMALPALAAGAEQLAPLLTRLGLALPELDPSQLVIELRVRFGLDPFERASLSAAGIDPEADAAVVDSGALQQPVLLLRLLADGGNRFETVAIARAIGREQLAALPARRTRGLEIRAWAAAGEKTARIVCAVDGDRLAFAPNGCASGVDCVVDALRPQRLLLQDRSTQEALAGLPPAALFAVIRRDGLRALPVVGASSAGERTELVALALGVERDQARLSARLLPTAAGRQQLAGYPVIGDRARQLVARRGALSLWFGVEPRSTSPFPLQLPYLAALRPLLAAGGLDLDRELRALADGGAALHVVDLEPQLPGLDAQPTIDPVSGAFFVEHALEVPLRDRGRGEQTVSALDRALGRRSGLLQLPLAASPTAVHRYSENGRVVDYALRDQSLRVASGPGTLDQLAAAATETVAADTFLALRADGAQTKALLGRVGLFGAGDNRALRALWAGRQVAAPLLGRLGALRLDLRRAAGVVVVEAQLELRGQVAPRRSGSEAPPP